jgi:hypothetical protein
MAAVHDRRFTPEQATQLRAWLLDQPDPAGDDDSPVEELDRLLAILEETTPDLPEETRKTLARAWGLTYRIACNMAAEEILPKLWEEVYGDLFEWEVHLTSALNWIKDRDPEKKRYPWSKHWGR